jgi:peptidoglycan-associated lipoprotein
MIKPLSQAALALTLAVLLAACESPSKVAGGADAAGAAPVETRTPVAAADAAGATAAGTAAGTAQSGVSTVDLNARSAAAAGAALMAAAKQRVIYFDFDSFVIKDDYKALLDAHAKLLIGDGSKNMMIEGHTDERGGREYNLALGQKRAEAVVKSLELLGVPDKQLEAVSFGEERPVATGTGEAAWARNRRAELKDR